MTAGFEGRVIDGRFELLERLGGGGMGLVWRARDIVLHREVALKEVRPPDPELLRLRPDAPEMLRKRVLREAVSLARITHPNVVTIHHIVSSPEVEHPWLVMELVSGGSLQDRLERGLCTPAEAARLGRGVLAGLRAAHEAGILHRDVKPGNVLLRTDGTPLLTDFGIAAVREATSLTNTGELVGSPDYMAPERLRGHDDEPSSDLWSLAMMLYVAVEGHHPMRRSSTLATLAAILEEDVPGPRQAGTLGPVLRSVLVKDVVSRPDAERLDRLLAEVAEERAAPVVEGARPASGPSAAYTPTEAGTPAPTAGYTPTEPGTPAPEDARPGGDTEGRGEPAATTGRTPVQGTGSSRAVRRVLIPGVLLTVVVAGLLNRGLIPGLGDDDNASAGAKPTRSAAHSPTPTPKPTPTPTPKPSPTPTADTDLVSAAGGRRIVKELKAVTGGTKVVSWFSIHQSHATGNVLVKDKKMPNDRIFDGFSYDEGSGKLQDNKAILDDQPLMDLSKVNWDTFPRLLRVGYKEMGVRNADPTQTYVIFDWENGKQAMRFYINGDYKTSAMLTASFDGTILRRVNAR
ncbi:MULTISPECIES: protein kinase domain-containing protein [unclassified Streptomyces]|uniref:serine/threonine-protein kinase n=1 Tax=unclassified Streptomyces TaxID=2593676 RepID=UPI002ED097F3|nr:protein kinase [Streptomyces sp. NBC_00891]WSY06066.1 protein kinase [Streptomyces sp. NBC_00890]WSZ07690.1 protein kinase [Streptomyces sp. NBC_00869]WSZ24811.1 protein kinase [Streptomyces sp. NBC_00870]